MTELVLVLLASAALIYYMHRKFEREQAVRDAQFEATMRALEEKAKRDGTFKVSYFDGEKK
ncbi:MAG: hypothetical protein EBX40_08345 [Gammaproteobacteria bacterium]|nr:hypothetical protein [Gammaproteobacteria bacterium]